MALLTAQQRLEEAQKAYHQLLTGGGVQRVQDQSGESITYTTANAGRLKAYIEELKLEVAGTTVSRGPIRPVFR